MMKHTDQETEGRWLDINEVRMVSDLRVMHSKVDELFHIVANLKRRHSRSAIHKYADQQVLGEDIERVDEIYLWFLQLKTAKENRPRLKKSR